MFHKLFPSPPIPTGTLLEELKEQLWIEKIEFIKQKILKSSNASGSITSFSPQDASISIVSSSDTSKYSPKSMPSASDTSSMDLPKTSGISKEHANHFQHRLTTTPTYSNYDSLWDYSNQNAHRPNNQNNQDLFPTKTDVSKTDVSNTFITGNSKTDVSNTFITGDSKTDVSNTFITGDSKTDVSNTFITGDSKTDVSNTFITGDSKTDVSNTFITGDSKTDVSNTFITGDSSPVINVLETSVRASSQERGNTFSETNPAMNAGGISVPLLPSPVPDPMPPSNEEAVMKQEQMTIPATPPNIMPPIDMPSQTETRDRPLQYVEFLTTPRPGSGSNSMREFVIGSGTKKEIIVQPDAFSFVDTDSPASVASGSSAQVSTKQDVVAAAVKSVAETLGPSNFNDPYPVTVRNIDAPTLSLSEKPMSPGILPGLSAGIITGSKQNEPILKQSEPSPGTRNAFSESVEKLQETQLLPSIPMLPGLIPKLTVSQNNPANTSETIPYQIGDLYLPVPTEANSVNTSNTESTWNVAYTENTDQFNSRATSETQTETKPILSDPIVTMNLANQQFYSETPSTKSLDPNFVTINLNQDKTQKTIVRDPGSTATRINSVDGSETIDLLSLLFPGSQQANAGATTNEAASVSDQAPDVMPDIVPASQAEHDSISISVTVGEGDDGTGCKLIHDYTGNSFCRTLYSKTCVKRPLKKGKTKILMKHGSLMKVESIAECSTWSILQYI